MGKNAKKAAQTNEVAYRRAKGWQIPIAMMQAASIATLGAVIGYVSYAANLGFGITTVIIGILLTTARIFDGITDPIFSFLIERVNTRFGKIRIFLAIGWIIQAVSLKMLFDWGCRGGHGIALFLVAYFLYYIGYTVQNMASMLVSPVLTNDPKQRPVVGVWVTVYNYIVNIVMSIIVTMVMLPRYGNEYTVDMLAKMTNIVIVASLVLLIISMIGLTPIDKPENFVVGSKEKIKIKDMWDVVRHNKALQCCMFAATSDKLAMQISGQSLIGTVLYGIIIGNMKLSVIINMVSFIPAIIFAGISAKYTGKRGSKEAMNFYTKISIGLNVVFIVFMLLTATKTIGSSIPLTIVFTVLTLVQRGMTVAVSTTTSSMKADVVDYEAARSGRYMPSLVAGVSSFIDKLVSSLGASIATACLAMVGYHTTVPQPTDPKTAPVFIMGIVLTYVIPILGWIVTVIALRFSPISKEGMVEVQKKIAAIKGKTDEVATEGSVHIEGLNDGLNEGLKESMTPIEDVEE